MYMSKVGPIRPFSVLCLLALGDSIPKPESFQEDVNGEKLTVKKWWIFGADFFMVYAEIFTVYKGHRR